MKKDGSDLDAVNIINKTFEYLEKNYPQKQKVNVKICEGYDCIETPEGIGFAVFVPDTLEIYIATDVPDYERTLIETMAHEYKHFMQYCEGKSFDEDEADAFALYILYLMQNNS